MESDQALALEALAFESENEDERLLAIRVLLARGGVDAARFLKRFETTDFRSNMEKMTVARAIGLDDGALPRIEPLSVDSELLARANQHIESSDAWERVLGAGLLASRDSDEARTSLTHLAESDIDPKVRAAAIRSLGTVGDRSTLNYLKEYFVISPFPPAELDIDVLEALKISMTKLEARLRTSER